MIIATKKGIVSEIVDAIPLLVFQTAQQRRQNRRDGLCGLLRRGTACQVNHAPCDKRRHDGQGNQQRRPDVVRLRHDWPLPCAFGSKRLIRWALLLRGLPWRS